MQINSRIDLYSIDSDAIWANRYVFKMYFYFQSHKYGTLKRFYSEIKRKTPSP